MNMLHLDTTLQKKIDFFGVFHTKCLPQKGVATVKELPHRHPYPLFYG